MAMLSAVEFALCVLSMFGRVLDENRMAVHVLLEAIKSYNPLTGQFGKRAVKQAGYGGRSSLRAIAAYLGKDYKMNELRTEEGAQAILHTILDPVLGSLTRQELAKIRKDVDEGIRLASSAPVEEVRAKVAEFILEAWKNGRREHWVDVWNRGMEAQAGETMDPGSQAENEDSDRSTSFHIVDSGTEPSWKFAVIPVMSTLERRARVPRSSRSSFPSPVDVCLGRSSSSSRSSDEWYKDTNPVWHPHGWKAFYPTVTSDGKPTSPVDFKFPPPGMLSATTVTATPTVDPEQGLETSIKLKQWEDEWEKQQLGAWKAAIQKDDALWFIVECIRDEKILHPHGWKKFDATTRSAHKRMAFRFPGPRLSPTSTATCPVDSDSDSKRCLGIDNADKYKKWEDSWEVGQLGKWSSGLKTRATKEGRLWNRLAMAWKSERVDLWAGMVEQHEEAVETIGSTSVGMRIGRLFGLA
ncbi:hypothetical protein B0J17DRAFT_692684 [Rhizoctonia solani]|nr:hypothetical protein B0J17DRAFT_692684 [Rhizoctonia solani]